MKLQVLVGCIASGKSTYSLNVARKGYICVNDDTITNMLHGGDYTLYDKNLKILYKSIENHIIANGLSMSKTVVVDRGLNISLQGRKRLISLAKSFDVPCEAIVFKKESPGIHAQRRTFSDARGHNFDYWLGVAKKHEDIYAYPSLEEGFDKIHEISFEEICAGKVHK